MNLISKANIWKNEAGAVLVESAFILPLAILIFAGIFETGRLLVLKQKLMNSAYNAADILSRSNLINDFSIDQAFAAGQITMEPFDASGARYGMNVAGVVFNAANNPQEIWQDKRYALFGYDTNLYKRTSGLGLLDEGFIIVKVNYKYQPLVFSTVNFFSSSANFKPFDMEDIYVFKSRLAECSDYDTVGVINDYTC